MSTEILSRFILKLFVALLPIAMVVYAFSAGHTWRFPQNIEAMIDARFNLSINATLAKYALMALIFAFVVSLPGLYLSTKLFPPHASNVYKTAVQGASAFLGTMAGIVYFGSAYLGIELNKTSVLWYFVLFVPLLALRVYHQLLALYSWFAEVVAWSRDRTGLGALEPERKAPSERSGNALLMSFSMPWLLVCLLGAFMLGDARMHYLLSLPPAQLFHDYENFKTDDARIIGPTAHGYIGADEIGESGYIKKNVVGYHYANGPMAVAQESRESELWLLGLVANFGRRVYSEVLGDPY
ncbi:hypothetical protein [Ascidiaceihabitans sp.]|uniref:hypothetical protein n=1 Tax=Ascidiaceihabitans sp. TaxID=1872644 RepID=UPI003298C84F